MIDEVIAPEELPRLVLGFMDTNINNLYEVCQLNMLR